MKGRIGSIIRAWFLFKVLINAGVDLIPVSGDKRLASNNRISSASALAKRIKVSRDSDDGIRDTDYLVYNWQ